MAQALSALSRETLTIPIPTGTAGITVPQIAIVDASSQPTEDDWIAAAVVGDTLTLLVGPPTPVVLTPANWSVWVRLTVGAERPVERVGRIVVY